MQRFICTSIVALFLVANAYGQEVRLQECWDKATMNYPRARDKADYEQIANLKVKNAEIAYFPKIDLNAQGSYQSDVTHVDASKIPIPNFNLGSPAKDQYKLTVDVSQLIWDGGATKAAKSLEVASLTADQQQVEVDLYTLKGRVAQLFYGIALKVEQQKLQNALLADLQEKIRKTASAVKQGASLKANELLLKAEIIRVEQDIASTQSDCKGLVDALAILVGEPISYNASFIWTENSSVEIPRPEFALFQRQKEKIEVLNSAYKAQRLPKITAFGQAGYGSPGLNMFSTGFDPFYVVGVKASWNIFDWNSTKNSRQVLKIQQQMVDSRLSVFELTQQMDMAQESKSITKYEGLLKQDELLVEARAEVAKTYSVMYDNGAIDAADYVGRVTELRQAELNREMHRVMLSFSKVNVSIIKGK